VAERIIGRREGAEAILIVAERMIGEQGVQGISLRQIAEAAGLATPSAVQYHFGGKEGLIRAIVDRHQPRLEARRYELTQALVDAGQATNTRLLVEAIYRPIAEIRDSTGRATYALFLREVRQRGYARLLGETRLRQPHLMRSMEYLRQSFADIPDAVFWWRHKGVVLFVANYLVMHDEDGSSDNMLTYDEMLDECFNAVCGLYRLEKLT
jgi:AcrR family transcriptional regulator